MVNFTCKRGRKRIKKRSGTRKKIPGTAMSHRGVNHVGGGMTKFAGRYEAAVSSEKRRNDLGTHKEGANNPGNKVDKNRSLRNIIFGRRAKIAPN